MTTNNLNLLLSLPELKKVRIQSGRIKRTLLNCSQIREAALNNEQKVNEGKAPQKKVSLTNPVPGERNKQHVITKYKASIRQHFGLDISFCIETDDGRPTLPWNHPNKNTMIRRIGSSAAKHVVHIGSDSESSLADDEKAVLFRKAVYSLYDLDSDTLDEMDALHFIRKAQKDHDRREEAEKKKGVVVLGKMDDLQAQVGSATAEGVGQVKDHLDTFESNLDKTKRATDKKIHSFVTRQSKRDMLFYSVIIILILVNVWLSMDLEAPAQLEPEASGVTEAHTVTEEPKPASTGWNLEENIDDDIYALEFDEFFALFVQSMDREAAVQPEPDVSGVTEAQAEAETAPTDWKLAEYIYDLYSLSIDQLYVNFFQSRDREAQAEAETASTGEPETAFISWNLAEKIDDLCTLSVQEKIDDLYTLFVQRWWQPEPEASGVTAAETETTPSGWYLAENIDHLYASFIQRWWQPEPDDETSSTSWNLAENIDDLYALFVHRWW